MTPKQIEKAFLADVNKIALKAIIKLEKVPLNTRKQAQMADNAAGTVGSSVEQFHRLPVKIERRLINLESKIQNAYDKLNGVI